MSSKRFKISLGIFLTITILSMFVFCLAGCFTLGLFESPTPIKLYQPNIEVVERISINGTTLIEKDEIEDIYNILYCDGKGRTTKSESLHDYPPNAENVLRIYINIINDEVRSGTTIFAFVRTGWSSNVYYYLESPYNGRFTITEEEYNQLAKYAKDDEQ